MMSFLTDIHCVVAAKNICSCNFIVIPMFLKEISTTLVQEVKIGSLFTFVAQKQLSFIIYYKSDNLYSVFAQFLVKQVLEIGLPWQQPRSKAIKKYT